ncbi:MAG: hypothetical protein CL609_18940 [Anaerolineaceae bacterium]|nr:hypothetical protein [Anaerolineaceae bacterium]
MKYQYRIIYKKNEPLRYTGNLDVHKIWERSFRRSKLPLAYSEGFHPQPRIQQASPLPLGFLSEYEMLDVYLTEEMDSIGLQTTIQEKVPLGLEILTIEQITNKEPALQVQVKAVEYKVFFLDPINENDVNEKIKNLMEKEKILRVRRKKEYDLRPLINQLELVTTATQPYLQMNLKSQEGATGRPEEVLSELGFSLEDTRIIRTMIYRSN